MNNDLIRENRIFWLDYLRAFIVFLVVTYHFPMPFHFHYKYLELFMMQLLFFIAGYFTYHSMRNGPWQFIKGKIIRILIPFLLVSVLLNKLFSYFNWLIDGGTGRYTNIFLYLLNAFKYEFFDIRHLWFLEVLSSYYILFILIYLPFRKRIDRMYTQAKEKNISFIKLILSIASFLLICKILSVIPINYSFLEFENFMFFPFRFGSLEDVTCLLYFIMGIVLYVSDYGNKLGDSLRRNPKTAYLAMSVIIILFIFCHAFEYSIIVSRISGYSLNRVFKGLLIILLLLLFFNQFLNRKIDWMLTYSRTSYTIYIIHLWLVDLAIATILTLNMNEVFLKMTGAAAVHLSSFAAAVLFLKIKGKIVKNPEPG